MTLGLKYKLITLTFGGARQHLICWCQHWAFTSVPDAYAQCSHQFLTCTLSARISSLCAWSACFWGPFQIWNFYAYAEHTCKKLMCMLRVRISSWWICSACFEGTALLKIRLSICVRNFTAPNGPLNIFEFFLYFNSKVALPYRFYGVKVMKIRVIENLTLGHLQKWWFTSQSNWMECCSLRYLPPQSTYFPRDETGLVCLPTQLERTLQLYWWW